MPSADMFRQHGQKALNNGRMQMLWKVHRVPV